MTAQLSPTPIFKAWDNNGLPLFLGQLFTYAAGTTTPQATYTDSTQTTQNTNPVILNARGEANVWLNPTLSYKLVLQDSLGNQIWIVDNIQGVLGPSNNIIPSADNQFSLGNASFRFANGYFGTQLYVGANNTPVLNGGIVGYWPQTAAEIAAGVTPTNYEYEEGDPRRYGGDPTGVSVSTTAVQAALNVAKAGSGAVHIGTNCNFLVGALSITLASSSGTTGLRISGSSMGGSRLTQSGTPSTLLTIAGPTPTGAPAQSQFVMENLSIIGSSTAGDGVLLQGLAWWALRNCFIVGFGKNLNLSSALTGRVEGGALQSGVTGMYARPDTTTGAACNLIRLRDVTIEGNTSWGVDIDGISGGAGATLLVMEGCDLETNGTALNYSTGGLHVGPNVSGTLGYSLVSIARCWFEANKGQTIQIDSQSGGHLFVSIRDSLTLSEDAGHSINAPSLLSIEIANTFSPSMNATWTLAASYSKLTNALAYTITDTSSQSVYDNAATHSGSIFVAQQAPPFTYKGTTASTATATAVTIKALPAAAAAVYLVSATVPNLNDSSDYSAVAVVSVNGTVASITTLQSAVKLTITLAFLQVQLTQTSGSNQVMQFSIVQIM